MPNGLLIVAFDHGGVATDEFNDWYDTEHIPERERVPGFLTCQRWLDVNPAPVAVALYDLAAADVLKSPAYLAIAYENSSPWTKRVTSRCKRLLRFEGTQTLPGDASSPAQAGAVLVNAMNVDPAHEADFNAWYEQEHIPLLAAVPGTLAARRFKATGSTSTHRYIALYHLESPQVTESDAWKKAVATPWTERIRPHFRDRLRILCRPYVRQAAARAA